MTFRQHLYCSVATGVFCLTAGITVPATAAQSTATASGAQIEEITVTAQRRTERLQDVPIAVTAISAKSTFARGITDTQALTQEVPGLTFSRQGPSGSIFLRGVGSNAGNVNDEPSVAMYIDDVYIAEPVGDISSLNNIDQIEVLRGPQGTLFGRNATGGVIQIQTREPTQEPRLDAQIGYGNYSTVTGSAYVSGGITSKISGNLALQASNQGEGWGRDFITGEPTNRDSSFSARTKYTLKFSDELKVRLALDYSQDARSGLDEVKPVGETSVAGYEYPGFYNSYTNTPGYADIYSGGISAKVDYDPGTVRFASISAFRKLWGRYEIDQDTTAVNFVDAIINERAHNYSQELQMFSEPDSPIQWVVGAFYYDLDGEVSPFEVMGLAVAPASYEHVYNIVNTTSESLYGQATAKILPNTKLTMGYRFTNERQKIDGHVETNFGELPPVHQAQGTDKGTWRVALDHNFSTDVLGYLSYNRGIKSGGFDILSVGDTGYRPEQLDAYEIGLKSKFFDRRVQLNLASFYYNYQNIQEQIALVGGTQTINAAKARSLGGDVDLQFAATRHLHFTLGLEYLSSIFLSFPTAQAYPGNAFGAPSAINVNGYQTPQAPKFTGNLSATYALVRSIGEFDFTGNINHNSGYSFAADGRLRQPAYTLANLSIGWSSPSHRYTGSLWVNNLTDTQYYNAATEAAFFGDIVIPAAPRTFGMTLGVHFF